ncbi:DUF1802 family protein [Nakamurella flava]|uniref:DUF1802 family protein n=1 Tax=Nakamurella flava TaxID=2576308 RepID=A0A4U6QPV5_9ACTN|nr:DUF1802 family protein [Nakamurella flava]
MPALKEWGAAIAALLAGRQTVLLRKGGIGEKRFTLGRSRFLLYPTVAHSHAESTRADHHDLLAVGARDVRLAPDGAPAAVTVRAVAEVTAAIAVARPDDVAALEPFHVWTTDSVRRNRIDFRPRHQLTAIVLSVRPITTPIELPVLPEYGGCRSWVDLRTGWDTLGGVPVGDPVVEPSALQRIADDVRSAVG